MITEGQYDQIQFLLGRKGKQRPNKHHFTYRGIFSCGECGGGVTAEEKFKKLSNGGVKRYVYYHCTRRKNPRCKQGSVEEKSIESEVASTLARLELPPEFREWALDVLREEHDKESEGRNRVLSNLRTDYDLCLEKTDKLIDMRAAGELTQDEFSRKKAAVSEDRGRVQKLLEDTDHRVDTWLQKAEVLFRFAENAPKRFKNGDSNEKRSILNCLGSNFLVMDRKVAIDLQKPLLVLERPAGVAREIYGRFEPLKFPNKSKKLKALTEAYTSSPIMLPGPKIGEPLK